MADPMTTTDNPTPEPITPDIAEGRRLLEAATPGTWEDGCESDDPAEWGRLYAGGRTIIVCCNDEARTEADFALVVWAKNNLDALLTEAETNRARAEAAEARLAEAEKELLREEIGLGETIDERDAAERALSQAFFLVVGRPPEWSNVFGHAEALAEIEEVAASWRSTGGEGDRAARLAQAIAAIKTAMRVQDLAEARVWMQVALDFASNDEAALAEGAAFVDPAPPSPNTREGE